MKIPFCGMPEKVLRKSIERAIASFLMLVSPDTSQEQEAIVLPNIFFFDAGVSEHVAKRETMYVSMIFVLRMSQGTI